MLNVEPPEPAQVEKPVELPPSDYARALVLWDALQLADMGVRVMPPEQIADLRAVCKYAASQRLRRHHEPKGWTKSRARDWLSDGGIAWQHARGFFLISETEKKINAKLHGSDPSPWSLAGLEITHRVFKPINVHIGWQLVECAFCGFLLLPARPAAKKGGAMKFHWTDWKLAVCRAHTDRCALRYLIDQGERRK